MPPEPLSLSEWDAVIAPDLNFILAGAEMVARRTEHLKFRPNFDTLAFEEIKRAESILSEALEKVRHAKRTYQAKSIGS